LRQASEGGQLYGSVNSRDIADAVTEAGFTVDRKQILLVATIKNVGVHGVRVSLHPEVSVLVSVNVARSDAEALSQERGIEPGSEADEEETGAPADVFQNPEDAATAEADSEADGGASNTGVEPGNDSENADQDSRAE
jgi:large subunit ribosomal protein L9